MLVLTRKQQEKIQIGDDIVITILKTKGKTVRIGVEAPSTVPVLRGELVSRIREEQPSSVPSSPLAPPSVDHTKSAGLSIEAEEPRAIKPPRDGNGWKSDGGAKFEEGSTRVSLERVSRSRVASVLSDKLGSPMADGRGPLRAMLDRRAGSAI